MITAGLCKWHTSSPPSPPRRRPSRTVMARRCDKHPVPPLHIVPLPGMMACCQHPPTNCVPQFTCTLIHPIVDFSQPPALFFLCSRLPTQYSSLACFSVHSVHPPLPDVTSSYSTSYIPQLTCTLSTQLLLLLSLLLF